MPKTTFVRKPTDINDVREGTEWINQRHNGHPIDSYWVAQEIQLPEQEFFDLQSNMLIDREWIREFSNWLHPMKGNAVPAMRVTCQGSLTVLIIDTQGYDYPRYVGFEIETE